MSHRGPAALEASESERSLENTEALALDAANYNHLLNQQRLLRRREAQDRWLSLCRQPDKGANSSTHLIFHGPEIYTDQHSCKRSSDMTSKQECLDDPVAVMNDGDTCEMSDLGHTEFTSPTKAHRSAALEQDCGLYYCTEPGCYRAVHKYAFTIGGYNRHMLAHKEGPQYCVHPECAAQTPPKAYFGKDSLQDHVGRMHKGPQQRLVGRRPVVRHKASSGVPVDEATVKGCREKMQYRNCSDSEDDEEGETDDYKDYRHGPGTLGQSRGRFTCRSLQAYAQSCRQKDGHETTINEYMSYLMNQASQEVSEDIKVERQVILDFNISIILMFPELQIILPAKKSACQGAALPSFDGYSEEICPSGYNETIWTCKLYKNHKTEGLSLSRRCDKCRFRQKIYQELHKKGLYTPESGSSCTMCDRPRALPRSKLCPLHAIRHRHGLSLKLSSDTAEQIDSILSRSRVSLERAWKPVNDAFKLLNSSSSPSHNYKDYVLIDLEFSCFNEGVVEIWQVSIVDLLGKPLVEVFIDWEESEREKHGDGYQHRLNKPEFATMWDFYHLRAMERRSGKRTSPNWTMQELAEELKHHVNRETTFIEYSYGGVDFNVLSKGLSHFGYPNLLGSVKHQSLPAIPTLKKAMPGITSWSLETIFPAFFPGSNLVDGNHDARVDTRQLAKLLALRFELAEPLDGRNDRLLSVWPVHERGFHGSPSQRQTGIRAEESVDPVPKPTGSIALGVKPGTAGKNMKHRAGTWGPDEVEFCRSMGDKMKEKGIMHPDGGFTCNCGHTWGQKTFWKHIHMWEKHCRSIQHRSANPDDPYICICGESLANAREDQKHEQSPKHSAWSEAYERIRSGLLLSFELRQKELASICVQGEGFRFDWRCTCGTVQSLFYPPTGMPPNKALETHIDGPCALRKFAYGAQPAELGYTCECGAILTSKTNSAGKPNTLKHHKTLVFHQAFLDSKDSECSECKILVDQSVGIARHLASPCHKFLKNLSDEERVRFLTSSPGLGTILRVCHVYQARKETVKVDCPECGLAFEKQGLWEHQVNNHFGTVCFFPACDHRFEDEKQLVSHLYEHLDSTTMAKNGGKVHCSWPGCKSGESKLRQNRVVRACMRKHQGKARRRFINQTTGSG